MFSYRSQLLLTFVDYIISFYNISQIIVFSFVTLVLIKHQVSLFRLSIVRII